MWLYDSDRGWEYESEKIEVHEIKEFLKSEIMGLREDVTHPKRLVIE